MTPYPIETAPQPELDHEPIPILVWCPDEGGWHTAIWFEGSWRLHGDIEHVHHPTHWLPAPPDVVVEWADPALSRAVDGSTRRSHTRRTRLSDVLEGV